ncbi:hypothetical protein HPG69_003728 [Diceros bicornis minor]|uniref:Uncharacterized protein n=1 Tax=Diceros bicornis minor TaxID=77932 RepID=A0A7J7ETH0_DICBM|nr:hypothetical protein HPG69_003728 [Diceros bicornis minor]
MVCYSLDPENPTKSCKSRGSSHHVHFKNICETAWIVKATDSLKDVPLQEQCMPPHCYSGGAPRPNSGARRRVRGPKRVLSFCLTCLKIQSNTELNSSSKNTALKMRPQTDRAQRLMNPHMNSCGHTEMILTEKEQIVAQKKKLSQKKLKKQKLMARE